MMHAQDSLSIATLTETHVPAALQLCREAGWNQLQEDWLRIIAYEPDGCFAAMQGGKLVGTVTTTRYGHDLAWIGMMLVAPAFRRRGVATQLMHRSIEYLNSRDVACIKLDATPEGQKVYEKLGFQIEWEFHRWCCEPPTGETNSDIQPIELDDLPDPLLDLDRNAFGANRSTYLERLWIDSTVSSEEEGYGMLRPGFLASYLGPLTASQTSTAQKIVSQLLAGVGGSIFWDIPSPNTIAVSMARRFGFTPIRNLVRMRLGESSKTPDLGLQFAMADPATG